MRLLLVLLLALHVRVAPEELLSALREDVAEHVRDLSLLLSHLVLDLLFFRASLCLRRPLLLLRRLLLRLLVLDEEEAGGDGILEKALCIEVPAPVAAD